MSNSDRVGVIPSLPQALKWERDEMLGENATVAMILYSNKNHPNLKTQFPVWNDRLKQIAKIWKTLSAEARQQYVRKARANKRARDRLTSSTSLLSSSSSAAAPETAEPLIRATADSRKDSEMNQEDADIEKAIKLSLQDAIAAAAKASNFGGSST